MEDRKYIEREMKRLLKFCRSHDRIYLYGAGNYGKGYLDVLLHHDIRPAGFIVSDPGTEECCGLKVYTAGEIAPYITGEDGVIPAFTNSVPKEIGRMFPAAEVLSFDHQVMLCMEDEILFYPVMDKLDSWYPGPGPLGEGEIWTSILVVRLDVIGDTVFTTGFLRELRRNFPESEISVVVRRQNYDLLKYCPYINRLFLYDGGLREGELSEQCRDFADVSARVREFVDCNFTGLHFDAVFSPRRLLCGRNAIDELLLVFYSNAKYRIGRIMADGLEMRFLHERVQKSFSLLSYQARPMHEAAYALDMLRDCGCRVEKEEMELWIDDDSREFAKKTLEGSGVGPDTVLVALGLVASVETRTWKIGNYKRLIHDCHKKYGGKVKFLLLGGPDAVGAAGELTDDKDIVINLAGKTRLDQTAACMAHCSLYVGSNTGLLHFASALGKPSVTIYSELSDGKDTDGDSPFRMGAWKVENVALVPPAGLDGCHGVCRMRRSHCINLITPMQVEQAMEKLLGF